MIYIWKARNQQGRIYSGKLQASSQQQAVTYIKNNYGYIISLVVVQQQSKSKLTSLLKWNRLRFSDKQQVMFFSRLAVIINSGISILKGLRLLQRTNRKAIGKVSRILEKEITEGKSLAAAMKPCKDLFSPLSINLVAVGEKTGELQMVLQEIANYYQGQCELKKFLYKNSIYPIFILIISLMLLFLFLCFILPTLAETYLSMGLRLTGTLQIAMLISHWLIENVFLLLLFLGCMIFGVYQKRNFLQRIFLNLPYIKHIYRTFLEMRFCKILSLLLSCGVNITEALTDVSTTFSDETVKKNLWLFNNLLKKGEDIGSAAQSMTNFFSPLTIELITIGASTGYLPKFLNEAAQIAEQDFKEKMAYLKEIFGPFLILCTALLVGMVVISVLEPIFDLFANLPEYS